LECLRHSGRELQSGAAANKETTAVANIILGTSNRNYFCEYQDLWESIYLEKIREVIGTQLFNTLYTNRMRCSLYSTGSQCRIYEMESHDQISWYELSAVRQCFGRFVAFSQVVYPYLRLISFHKQVGKLQVN
jgi:hypothetical protein